MIPKIIHYCWLSDDPIPEKYLKYRQGWEDLLSGYSFVFWNKDRFDVNQLLFTKQAYDSKKYAFAADYIRLYALYNYGGIYLDMDIEVIRPFDSLLNSDLMMAYENHISENIEAGCLGSEKGNLFILKCMEYYETHEYLNPPIIPELMKNVLLNNFPDIKNIFSNDYFTAKNVMTGKINISKNTFAIHHFVSDYLGESTKKNRVLEQQIRFIFGENNIISRFLIKHCVRFRDISETVIIRSKKYGYKNAFTFYLKKYILNIKDF